MSDSIATDLLAPVGTRLFPRWHQRPATRYQASVRSLRRVLRRFSRRHTFRTRDEVIGTRPWAPEREVVVGTVSPQYVLIQHEELLDSVASVMAKHGYDLDSMPGVLTTTNYCERIQLTVVMPDFSATPPDGYPLECRLRCLNSVDATTSLEAELQWYRQICSNGMFGWCGIPVRHVHRYGDVLGWVRNRLATRLQEASGDGRFFSELMDKEVSAGVVRDWVDVFVTRHWGPVDAARVYHICTSGKDGHVSRLDEHLLPHEMPLWSPFDVQGACAPARNVYHIGQALSWVAGQAENLHTSFSRTSAIPSLLKHLLN